MSARALAAEAEAMMFTWRETVIPLSVMSLVFATTLRARMRPRSREYSIRTFLPVERESGATGTTDDMPLGRLGQSSDCQGIQKMILQLIGVKSYQSDGKQL